MKHCVSCLRYRTFSITWPASMQIYGNKRKNLHKKRVQLPCTGLVWNTNMAAVLLFWNTNMAAVTSCENALFFIPGITFLRYPKGIIWNSGWLCRWNLANLGLYHTMFNTTHDKAPKISVLPNHAETSVRHTSHQFPMNDIPDQNLHHYHTLCQSITSRKPFPSQGHIPLEFIYGRKSTPMRYHTKCDPQNIFFVFHRWRFEVAVHQIGCG